MLPHLPGKKLIQGNSDAHLSKRVGRYQEYLTALLGHTLVGRSELLASFLSTPSQLHRPTDARAPSILGSERLPAQPAAGLSGTSRPELARNLGPGSKQPWEVDPRLIHDVDRAVLEREVLALRAQVQDLEAKQRQWETFMRQILQATFFNTNKTERYRLRLERKLQQAILTSGQKSIVSDVQCTSLQLPQSAPAVPCVMLIRTTGPGQSVWSMRWHKGACYCDLKIRGKKLGLQFECAVRLTFGLEGEFEARVEGGENPRGVVSFTADPLVEVGTSDAKVLWGSISVPLQEAVSREVQQHALEQLKKTLSPTKEFTVDLSRDKDEDDDGAVSPGQSPAHRSTKSPHSEAGPSHPPKPRPSTSWSEKGAKAKQPPVQRSWSMRRIMATKRDNGASSAKERRGSSQTSSATDSESEMPELGFEGEVVEESIGLSVRRIQEGRPLVISRLHPGGVAERSLLLQEGDELTEIGAQPVGAARLEVVRALLGWPPGLDRRTRLVQLTLRRGRQLMFVNLDQQRPEEDEQRSESKSKSKSKWREIKSISGPSNVSHHVSIRRDSKTGALLGVPSEWHKEAPQTLVDFPTLGFTLEVGAFDGVTRIESFESAGPAEQSELLLINDEVTSIDGQNIPVGISAAQGRLKRLVEKLGSDQRFVEVTVRRKSPHGVAQLSYVKLRSRLPPDTDSDASEEAEATEEVRRGFDADAAQSHSTKCEIVLSKAARDPLPVPRTQSRDPLPVT